MKGNPKSSFMIFYYSSKTCSFIHFTRSLGEVATSAGGDPEGRLGDRLGKREGVGGGFMHSQGCHSAHPEFTPSPLSTVGQTPRKHQPVTESHCSVTGCAHSTYWARRSRGISRALPRGGQLSLKTGGQGGASLELYCLQIWFSQFSQLVCTHAQWCLLRVLHLHVISPTHFSHWKSSGNKWACRLPTLSGTTSDLPNSRRTSVSVAWTQVHQTHCLCARFD